MALKATTPPGATDRSDSPQAAHRNRAKRAAGHVHLIKLKLDNIYALLADQPLCAAQHSQLIAFGVNFQELNVRNLLLSRKVIERRKRYFYRPRCPPRAAQSLPDRD